MHTRHLILQHIPSNCKSIHSGMKRTSKSAALQQQTTNGKTRRASRHTSGPHMANWHFVVCVPIIMVWLLFFSTYRMIKRLHSHAGKCIFSSSHYKQRERGYSLSTAKCSLRAAHTIILFTALEMPL